MQLDSQETNQGQVLPTIPLGLYKKLHEARELSCYWTTYTTLYQKQLALILGKLNI